MFFIFFWFLFSDFFIFYLCFRLFSTQANLLLSLRDPLLGGEVVLTDDILGVGVIDSALRVLQVGLAVDRAFLDFLSSLVLDGRFDLRDRLNWGSRDSGLSSDGSLLHRDLDFRLFLDFLLLRGIFDFGDLRIALLDSLFLIIVIINEGELGNGLRLRGGNNDGLRVLSLLDIRLELTRVLGAPDAERLLLGVVLAEVRLTGLLELATVTVQVLRIVAHHLENVAVEVLLLVEGTSIATGFVIGDGTGLRRSGAGTGFLLSFDLFSLLRLFGDTSRDRLQGLDLDVVSQDLSQNLLGGPILVFTSNGDGLLQDSVQVDSDGHFCEFLGVERLGLLWGSYEAGQFRNWLELASWTR